MVRWEPGARERLQVAALDLYVSQGFEPTTVAQIAASVGLTERTFFRHFTDKREVLFDGQDLLQQLFFDGVNAAPLDATPLEVVAVALTRAAEFFPAERRAWSRQRQSVIDANPALQERELLKLARLARVVAEALRARGIPEPAASLAAESGRTVFAVAFAEWIADTGDRSLADVANDVFAALGVLTSTISAADAPSHH